ncbi:MAG: MaoC family dehydratase [Dehalococcoidia bacterium]|nr:MaoC family dehydratase [Dehalococcoidia bacterium]
MTERPISYITPELRARIGVEHGNRVSSPVERGEIRRWAIAAYWPERPPMMYWDEAYAKTTRWGGIIAPPDFNPFAWPIDEEGFDEKVRQWRQQTRGNQQQKSQPGTRTLNGGTRVEYFSPIRPGNVITTASKLIDVREREGGRTGLMLITETETRWTNERGQLIRISVGTSIRY